MHPKIKSRPPAHIHENITIMIRTRFKAAAEFKSAAEEKVSLKLFATYKDVDTAVTTPTIAALSNLR
jgi:hypothetical protein